MSIIDQVRGPLPLSWLRKSATVEAPAEMLAPRLPSLASIEYELYELRASLRGVVDFGDEKPKSSPNLASPPSPSLASPPSPSLASPPSPNLASPPSPNLASPPSPSLKRNNALQDKLVTLAS